ncbi:MAG: glycosyltransferase family 39 protein [Leptolyngbyaceae cyanobacterium bins.349]|nr:glycosyltransferase family 39 protein [Leptolyngbyaceae cyanobacterium bins.349]
MTNETHDEGDLVSGWDGRTLKIGQFSVEQWTDGLWVLGLSLAALVLVLVGLGDMPLRDWDEGIVAQVAREIWRSQTGQTPDSLTWLYPTLNGAPYLNKPTLMHWLIAQCFGIGGVNEWMARLPGALLSALSVPLLYGIGREVFLRRTPAIFAALIYLTLLPVIRHGRLAMLDGALVCFFLLMMYCLLRSRRDLRWGLGVGIGFGLTCLTKGAVGLLLAAIALGFTLWDTPRLLTSGYLWTGVLLGSAPVVAWFWAQWQRYGALFIGVNVVDQSFSRLWVSVEGNQGPIWYYLVELLKYTLPWLIFLPQALKLAWENRNWSWAKLVLVWSCIYFGVISLMGTKLPWYILPLYPALALASGAMLSQVWDVGDFYGVKHLSRQRYPAAWMILFGLMAVFGWAASLYLGLLSPMPQLHLSMLLGAIALTLSVATILLVQHDSQFILVLFWGTYMTLGMVMMSPYWLWELQESFAVKPVAALIQQQVPAGQTIMTSYPHSRPSLNFYSDRAVVSVKAYYDSRQISLTTPEAVARYWQENTQPYLLLDEKTSKQVKLPSVRTLGNAEDFVLITRQKS